MSEHGTSLVPPPPAAGGMYRQPPRPGVPSPGIRPSPGPPPGRPPMSYYTEVQQAKADN